MSDDSVRSTTISDSTGIKRNLDAESSTLMDDSDDLDIKHLEKKDPPVDDPKQETEVMTKSSTVLSGTDDMAEGKAHLEENITSEDSPIKESDICEKNKVLKAEENAVKANQSEENFTDVIDRRKQAIPRKRGLRDIDKDKQKETIPSKIRITEDLGQVKQDTQKLGNQGSKRNVKNVRKQSHPQKVGVSPPEPSTSSKALRSSSPKNILLEVEGKNPKKIVSTPAKKSNSGRKKAVINKTATLEHGSDKILTPVNEVGNVSNEDVSGRTQPALSLKIICTPFTQNNVEGSRKKEDSEIPTVNTSNKKKSSNKRKASGKEKPDPEIPVVDTSSKKKTTTTSRASGKKKPDPEIPVVDTSSKKKTTTTSKKLPSNNKKKTMLKSDTSCLPSSPLKVKLVKLVAETEPKIDQATKRGISSPVKSRAKKGASPKSTENKEKGKVAVSKSIVKREEPEERSLAEEHQSNLNDKLSTTKNVPIEKKTRGKRKLKKSAEYVTDFMDGSDNDIELDSSEDEYLPSKDADLSTQEKLKFKKKQGRKSGEFMDGSDGIDAEVSEDDEKTPKKQGKKKKNLRVSFSCVEDNDDGEIKKTKRSPKVRKELVAKTPRKKSPTKSPTKVKGVRKQRAKKKGSESDGGSQNESGLDMPILSPKKGRAKRPRKLKQKKRKIRSHTEKTYIDGYTTGEEEFDMNTASDEEGDGLGKVHRRKRKKRHGDPFSVTGSWYIAQGYLFDISNLIEKFVKEDGWRFKDFARCWQELKFSLVYRGRQNFKELLEFSEEVALLTKRFIMPPHTNKARIGSLYALYGLYYKHPFRHFFKIRLLLDEYEELVDLILPFQNDAENPDPAYIFRKLEVNGAIYHVASSLEMGIDFYNAEREAVDIKYESQRLAHSSSVSRALMPDLLDEDDEILKMYHSTKLTVAGDGQQPEKALAFVEPSTAAEIKDLVINLKEETLTILRLNDPPTAKVVPSLEDDGQRSIGARRAEIVSKAGKADTGSEYIRKKRFREPLKPSPQPLKPSPQQGLPDENNSVSSGQDVQNSKKSPKKESLTKPVIPQRRSQRNVPHKFIKRCREEEASPVTVNETISENVEDIEGKSLNETDSSLTLDSSVGENSDPLSVDLETLTKVPPVLPKPKRVRPPRRSRVLSEAAGLITESPTLTGLKALKKKTHEEILRDKRLKRRALKKIEPDGEDYTDLSRFGIIDLPPDETQIIVPVKMEERIQTNAVMNNFEVNGVSSSSVLNLNERPMKREKLDAGVAPNMNERPMKFENVDSTITLNIQLKGENIDKSQHFKISSHNWMAIQNNPKKLDGLKKKLKSIIIPDHVKHIIDEDKVEVDITLLEIEGSRTAADTHSVSRFSADTSSIDADPPSVYEKIQANIDACSMSGTQNISLKMEKPDFSPQKKTWSASDVIKDLQGIWDCDTRNYGNTSVGIGHVSPLPVVTKTEPQSTYGYDDEGYELFHSPSRDSIEEGPDLPLMDEYRDSDKDMALQDESFVDLVSDVDDFEDESEPIILTPNIVSGRHGYSLGSRNMGESENDFKLIPSGAPSVGSSVELEDSGMPVPLNKIPKQVPLYRPQEPVSTESLNQRYFSSPVLSTGHITAIVPVSSPLPLLKNNEHQSTYLQLRHPSNEQYSSVTITKDVTLSHPVSELGQNLSTSNIAVSKIVSQVPPYTCLVTQTPISCKPVTSLQSPLLPDPTRFPGSVTITPQGAVPTIGTIGISTPVTEVHSSSSGFAEGIKSLPPSGRMKIMRVKINDTDTVFIPTSSKKNIVAEMPEDKVSSLSAQLSEENRIPVVSSDSANQSAESENTVDSALPLPDQRLPCSSTVGPTSSVGQEECGKSESSNSSWVSTDSKSSSFSTSSSNKVCSFLFSPKFTKRSGIKGTASAQATGVPVPPKKFTVPFLFKRSLVPKKKSL